MKKVLALVGSRAGRNSHTRRLCAALLEELENVSGEELVPEIITAEAWNINCCLSCGHCFQQGFCVQDSCDGMGVLREKILGSDIFILASPVFAGAVSGDTKTLIDRLSFWLHLMPLIGKVGVPLCTASSNHAGQVLDYLTETLEYLGASVPAGVQAYRHYGDVLLQREDQLHPYLQDRARVISDTFRNGLTFSDRQELYFKIQNRRYVKQLRFAQSYPCFEKHFSEARQWHTMGYDQYGSILDVIRR